jgi:EAL domain-containing protein (putative c-di-GMP-specific phosphodiesterase class I)
MQVTEVKDSFDLEQVVPFFQPIMDLANNAVWSYECLARLLTLEQNRYLPSEFLFLVERQQSVAQLTQTVFSRSANYFRDINMAWNINLSLADMIDPGTFAFLQEQLESYPNPKRISIEITAQNALAEPAIFEQFARVCSELGVKIVIDNFNQNECDADVILKLPISAIKVAADTFDKVSIDAKTATFVHELIVAAKVHNVALIAERIESKESLDRVQALGVKYAQGFYFSQPKAQTA